MLGYFLVNLGKKLFKLLLNAWIGLSCMQVMMQPQLEPNHCQPTYNKSMRHIKPWNQEQSTSLLSQGPNYCPFQLYFLRSITLICYHTHYFKTQKWKLGAYSFRKPGNWHIHQRGSVRIKTRSSNCAIFKHQKTLRLSQGCLNSPSR